MQQSELAFEHANPVQIGNERETVAQAADVFSDPEAVIETACTGKYDQINAHYPGVRAPVPDRITQGFCDRLGEIGRDCFGIEVAKWDGHAWFSLVTCRPEKLTPIQRLPHFDGFDPRQLAVMVYLNTAEHGGTNFYRHLSTGFETMSEDRFAKYRPKLEADVGTHGLPPAQYADTGAPLFCKTASFQPVFNSLIFYRGCALHSGSIRSGAPLSSDPRQGRLTINGFFKPA